MVAPLALLGTFQAIREELPANWQANLQLIDILPDLPWWIWVIAILVIVIFMILESAYLIIKKRHNRKENVLYFAELVREAKGLRISNVNSSTPELDMIFKEAITWTIKALADISTRVGTTVETAIRSDLELPLQGEIKEQDFYATFAYDSNDNKLNLVRKCCYGVRNWLQDYVRGLPPEFYK